MPPSSSPSSRTSRFIKWGSIPAGLVISGLLIWQASHAAFSDATTNPGNSWETGSVVITDDDEGVAMFTATNLAPGDSGSNCIATTYEGSLPADARFYAGGPESPQELAEHIDLTITKGQGGGFGSCEGFEPAAETSGVYQGTLANLTSNNTNFENGRVIGDTLEPGDVDTYMFEYTFSSDAPNSVQGGTATADFTWEAQSSSAN